MSDKKRYSLRFYKVHDPDIIGLIARNGLNINKAVYCCLASFIRKDTSFAIEIPRSRVSINRDRLRYVYRL